MGKHGEKKRRRGELFAVKSCPQAAERPAHTIKGASAGVEGKCLGEVAFDIEKAGKAGNLDAATMRMDDLEKEFERLKEAMGRES